MSESAVVRQAWRVAGGPAPEGPYTELRGAARVLEVDYRGAFEFRWAEHPRVGRQS